jgi:hypothetical protein
MVDVRRSMKTSTPSPSELSRRIITVAADLAATTS